MATANADAEEAVLNMLQRYEFETIFYRGILGVIRIIHDLGCW